jgi:serine/threonine-protein kinase
MEDRKRIIAKFASKKPSIDSDLSPFELGGPIGEGATSRVYEAKISGSDQRYAVKIYAEDTDSGKSTGFKRFLQTYINLLSYQHLGFLLPQIYWGFLTIDGKDFPYSVMLRADSTLDSKFKKDEVSFQMFVEIFQKLSVNIEKLHACGIIHRDLKPQNIFLLDGNWLIGDCDIASFDDSKHLKLVSTEKGDRLANFSFSAPEQSEPLVGQLTVAADWYAFGQILYWLANKTTYRGTGPVSLGFEDKKNSIYEQIVIKLLETTPQKRFQTLKEIQDFQEKLDESAIEHFRILKIGKSLTKFDEIIYKYTSEYSLMSRTCISEVTHPLEIRDICEFLMKNTDDLNLWMCRGGYDFEVEKLFDKGATRFIFGNQEIDIEKITVFRFYLPGGSLLVLHARPIQALTELYFGQDEEEVCLFGDIRIKRSEFDAGWARIDGSLTELHGRASVIVRTVAKTFFFLSPEFGPYRNNFDLLDMIFEKYKDTNLDSGTLEAELKGIKRSREASMFD